MIWGTTNGLLSCICQKRTNSYKPIEPLFSYLGADREDLGARNVGLRRKEDVRGQLGGVLQLQLIRVCCLFGPTLPSAGPGEGNEDAHPRPRLCPLATLL